MTATPAKTTRLMNTRRWPRFHVHLPVSIATGAGGSTITVPGLVSELSRGGMELYGGVHRRPGDLLEVEFRTSETLRVAAVVRSRSGYCFGLEFLNLTTVSLPEASPPEPGGTLGRDGWRLTLGAFGIEPHDGDSSGQKSAKVVPDEAELAELFLVRHDAYLRDRELIIRRLRQRALEIRRFRQEMEILLESGSPSR